MGGDVMKLKLTSTHPRRCFIWKTRPRRIDPRMSGVPPSSRSSMLLEKNNSTGTVHMVRVGSGKRRRLQAIGPAPCSHIPRYTHVYDGGTLTLPQPFEGVLVSNTTVAAKGNTETPKLAHEYYETRCYLLRMINLVFISHLW